MGWKSRMADPVSFGITGAIRYPFVFVSPARSFNSAFFSIRETYEREMPQIEAISRCVSVAGIPQIP